MAKGTGAGAAGGSVGAGRAGRGRAAGAPVPQEVPATAISDGIRAELRFAMETLEEQASPDVRDASNSAPAIASRIRQAQKGRVRLTDKQWAAVANEARNTADKLEGGLDLGGMRPHHFKKFAQRADKFAGKWSVRNGRFHHADSA